MRFCVIICAMGVYVPLYAYGSLHTQLQYVFMSVCLFVSMGLSSSLSRCGCFLFFSIFYCIAVADITSQNNLEPVETMQFNSHTVHVQSQHTFFFHTHFT